MNGLPTSEPQAAERAATVDAVVPCDYAVEATDYEALCLWREWSTRVAWEQETVGQFREIGRVGGMPVCVCLGWVRVAGRRVLVYHATSQVVDHRMVDAWVRANAMTSHATHSDAMNFHNVVLAIQRASEGDDG